MVNNLPECECRNLKQENRSLLPCKHGLSQHMQLWLSKGPDVTSAHSRILTRSMFSGAEPKSCQRNCFPQTCSNYPGLTVQAEQKQGPNQTRGQMWQKTGPQLSCISVQHYATVIYGRYPHKFGNTVTNVHFYFQPWTKMCQRLTGLSLHWGHKVVLK